MLRRLLLLHIVLILYRLKKDGIHFCNKMFRNIGHAELIHKNPKALIRLIDKAFNGKISS